MTAGAIERLFPGGPGSAIYFQGTFNGTPFTKCWAVLDKADADGYRFDFFLELDRKVIGQGGTPITQHAALRIDPELRPVAYLTEAMGARLALDFTREAGKVHVMMPDGSMPIVARENSEFVVEANITGLDALLYAIAHERIRNGEQLTLFLLNKLMPIPYSAKVVDATHLRSTYDEEVELDADGRLQSVGIPKQGVIYARQDPAPPLPAWRLQPEPTMGESRAFAKYRIPADATFKLEDVTIGAAAGAIGGSITVPKGTGPFPAVLFLSGTGTHNRHGIAGEIDIGTHEIMDYLSDHGFVGLRFDTRGAGSTRASNTLTSSLEPLLADARACLAYLRARPEVDRSKILLLGHSQGALVAMTLAAESVDKSAAKPADKPIKAIALIAAMGRPLDEILDEQMATLAERLKLTSEQRERQMQEFHALLDNVRAGKKFEVGEVPDYLVPLARDTAWLKEHLDAPPAGLMAKVKCPVWLGQGASDFQVTQRDAEVLETAAKAAGISVTKVVFPGLDHLFKHIDGESTLESYQDLSRHVDVGFLGQLDAWLHEEAA